jgi:hypothetical protein
MCNLEAEMFASVAPEFEVRDGMFLCTQRVGGMVLRFVYPPATFLKAIRSASRASDAFRQGCNVVPLRKV